ncbi:response regulator [Mucisphaera sp.]|uniref:response regulator n=1 Tax=Mucisphaera sp. TaxID=2913024 RepID=UPI003D0C8241
MTLPHKLTENSRPTARAPHQPLRVLVVDHPGIAAKLIASPELDGRSVRVEQAETIGQARQFVDERRFDVALIHNPTTGKTGLQFAAELVDAKSPVRSVIISNQPTVDDAVTALRVGAVDLIEDNATANTISNSLRRAVERIDADNAGRKRINRLRKLCKKLNEARIEVSQQVDVLCNDLVTAYQELANQMQHMVQSTEYGTLIKEELDLENLIRRTLEHLVEKTGPTNAAIYLPSSVDEFSLGGYVNADADAGASDILLDHLGDRIPQALDGREDLLHLTDDQALAAWMGQEQTFLEGSDLVAMPCRAEDETLAVLILFRDRLEPYDDRILETIEAIGPLLGESLAKVIRVHHRHMGDELFEPEDDEGDNYAF